jgi:DNA-binding response OmpR family regulator
MKEDTIEGFKSGGDDYITKPFSMEELLYRIKAILKRSGGADEVDENKHYTIASFNFDPNSQVLERGKEIIHLTSKESHLLKVLCQNRNQTLQREVALKMIWGDDTYFNARSMDVYVSKLRKHFKSDQNIEIVNIHGKGFKLVTRNN